MMKRFVTLYAPDAPRFDDIQALAQTLGFAELINQTTFEYNVAHGVSEKYIFELLESMTRVNYGQVSLLLLALEGP